jgi:hypothetical protein
MAALPDFFGTSTSAYTGAEGTAFGSLSWRTAPAGDPLAQLLRAAGLDAAQVPEATQNIARTVLLLLANKPAPQVALENTGEISFEWYRDNDHVAVLTVDDSHIRWAAMLDRNRPDAGAERFNNLVPVRALVAIDAAI